MGTNSISTRKPFIRMTGAALGVLSLLLGGCATTGVANESGAVPVAVDPSQRGPVSGVGIEGQDVVAMTDQMIRDMLANPRLSNASKSPRVIIDAEFFANESTQPFNKNLIVNRMRTSLNRASNGRIQFVGNQYSGAVAQARELKRKGVTDIGTTGLTKAQLGADYRLGGTIASLDSRNSKTGMIQRYYQINFEMFDLETSEIVWSGLYEFARAGADDVVYR